MLKKAPVLSLTRMLFCWLFLLIEISINSSLVLPFLVTCTRPDLAFVVFFLSIFLDFLHTAAKRFLYVTILLEQLFFYLVVYLIACFYLDTDFTKSLDTLSCCLTTKAEYILFPLIKQLGISTSSTTLSICRHTPIL